MRYIRRTNLVVACAIAMHCPALGAQTYLHDPFENDDPIRVEGTEWQLRSFGSFGAMDFDDGNLLLASRGGSYLGIASNGRLQREYRDFSLQTQVRAVELPNDWMFAGMLGRFLRQDNHYGSYYIGIGTDSNQIRYGESLIGGQLSEIGIDVPFDVRSSDVILKLDMIGPVVRGWAWEAGEMQPDQPLFEFEDDSISLGSVGFWVNTDGSQGEAAFDWFSVAPLPAGDFDGSGALAADDIDHVASRIRGGSNNLIYDLDQNAVLDVIDLKTLVHDAFETWIGDANLDGEFNTGDLVEVFSGGQYEDDVEANSTWATGDWNGDGEFGSGDLVAAFEDGGFEVGPRPAVATVPEPSSLCVFAFASCLLCWRCRRRH